MEGEKVKLIDQNLLPFRFEIIELENWEGICKAIVNECKRSWSNRSCGCYAMALAFIQSPQVGGEEYLWKARQDIEQTRPTARDLFYATERVMNAGIGFGTAAAIEESQRIAFENEEEAKAIAIYGESLMLDTCNALTHCNAGWLGFVDWGSALAPIYLAHRNGKKIFVYVDETRPRLQGSRLTAWELQNEGIPHVIVADNAGAWLLSNHKVIC
jgi:methylthioribose-1-phosphate isomerase